MFIHKLKCVCSFQTDILIEQLYTFSSCNIVWSWSILHTWPLCHSYILYFCQWYKSVVPNQWGAVAGPWYFIFCMRQRCSSREQPAGWEEGETMLWCDGLCAVLYPWTSLDLQHCPCLQAASLSPHSTGDGVTREMLEKRYNYKGRRFTLILKDCLPRW